jgi:RND family efflux transporter MFP subunit
MKNKVFNKELLRYIVATIFVVLIGIFTVIFFANAQQVPQTETANVQTVSQNLVETGNLQPQTQAILNFQIGGKLVYLPFKQGDTVSQGQTIASLDTYALQKQLQIAANSYQTSQNSANQALDNQQAGVAEGQQRTVLDTTNKNSYSSLPEDTIIYNNVKRIVDNATLAQNSAQINVDLANYTLSLASLTSPINGIVLREDVTTAGVNITPVTSFVIADPSSMVFAANVRQQDIDFISVGNKASVLLDSASGQYVDGVVDRIYPQQTTLSNGDQVYRVDIKINNLPTTAKFYQSGTVLIKSNFNQKVILVPSWTILSQNYVWVVVNGKPILKKVSIGNTINGQTEIWSGLSESDKVITNPKAIISNRYQVL